MAAVPGQARGRCPYTYFCGLPKSRLAEIPYGRCPRARPYTAMH
jgi:hypothetical protein